MGRYELKVNVDNNFFNEITLKNILFFKFLKKIGSFYLYTHNHQICFSSPNMKKAPLKMYECKNPKARNNSL